MERRAGVVFRYFVHTPAGELLYSIDAATNVRRYYHYDEMGNNIYYVRARYYDAVTARFVSRDAKKSITPKQLNPYQYALNNPLRYVDVDGLNPNDAAAIEAVRTILQKANAEIDKEVQKAKA